MQDGLDGRVLLNMWLDAHVNNPTDRYNELVIPLKFTAGYIPMYFVIEYIQVDQGGLYPTYVRAPKEDRYTLDELWHEIETKVPHVPVKEITGLGDTKMTHCYHNPVYTSYVEIKHLVNDVDEYVKCIGVKYIEAKYKMDERILSNGHTGVRYTLVDAVIK